MQPLVTDIDNARLRGLMTTPAGRRKNRAMWMLVDKLNQARIVPSSTVPPTIVTMNSRAACWDSRSGKSWELSLVYPWNEKPNAGKVSILSRLGVEMLGATPGRELELDDGTHVRIAFLSYQPEAERQFHR